MARYKTIGITRTEREDAVSIDEAVSFLEDDHIHDFSAETRETIRELWPEIPTSPQITLQEARNPLIPHFSERHEVADHRRSRSYEVTSRTAAATSTSVANNGRQGSHGNFNMNAKSCEVPASSDADSSWTSFAKTIPKVMLTKRVDDWQSGPTTAPIGELLSPLSPRGASSDRPQSYSFATSRKEKRYSMLLSSPPPTPQPPLSAATEFSFSEDVAMA